MSLPQINTPVHELTIPSTGKKIKYRPFVVREEKILLLALESEDQKEITDAIVQIIGNCVQSKIDIDSAEFNNTGSDALIQAGDALDINVTAGDIVNQGGATLFGLNSILLFSFHHILIQ